MRSIAARVWPRSEEHTSELQSRSHLVCRLLLEKKNKTPITVAEDRDPKGLYKKGRRANLAFQTSSSRCWSTRRSPLPKTAIRIFFLKDRATTEIYTLPPPAPLPI